LEGEIPARANRSQKMVTSLILLHALQALPLQGMKPGEAVHREGTRHENSNIQKTFSDQWETILLVFFI
jgi:hypothetical protein